MPTVGIPCRVHIGPVELEDTGLRAERVDHEFPETHRRCRRVEVDFRAIVGPEISTAPIRDRGTQLVHIWFMEPDGEIDPLVVVGELEVGLGWCRRGSGAQEIVEGGDFRKRLPTGLVEFSVHDGRGARRGGGVEGDDRRGADRAEPQGGCEDGEDGMGFHEKIPVICWKDRW